MWFLLRLTFWLGLVLVLLPRDKKPESEKAPQIGASDAVQAATAAVSDMSQFCKRQPAACEVGGQAATVIGVRAQDRKSTRLNSSHVEISYAVFCLKKKKNEDTATRKCGRCDMMTCGG